MSKSYFSTYCDYYHRCRIFNVEEAKKEFIKCNSFLLGSKIDDSPAMKLLADKTKEERQEIYETYNNLCKDFMTTAQKLIDKENIECEEDYIHDMELLMLIANQTIMFTCKEFYMHGGSCLREKHFYDSKKICLSAIIEQNNKIPYILNPDDIATVFTDKYGNTLLWWTGISFVVLGFVLLYHSIYISELQTLESIMEAIWLDIFIWLGAIICYFHLRARKKVKYDEKKSKVYSRNQYLVVRPYRNKFTFKKIKEILEIMSFFKK